MDQIRIEWNKEAEKIGGASLVQKLEPLLEREEAIQREIRAIEAEIEAGTYEGDGHWLLYLNTPNGAN